MLLSRSHDFATPIESIVTARPDGSVLCMTCSGTVLFDPRLNEKGHIDTGSSTQIAIAPDGAFYALIPGAPSGTAKLVAFSAANELRWTESIPTDSNGILARTEGPYVQSALTIRGFDALTGEPRSVATVEGGLVAAARGSLFTLDGSGRGGETLRRLDLTGNVLWSHAITVMNDGLLFIQGAVATADDGMIVFGSCSSTVDFGDRTLPCGAWFVAGFDASGATQGAFAFSTYTTRIALTAQGEILLAGQSSPPGAGDRTDALLSVATLAGISRTIHIDGPGAQVIVGLAATPDGLAWIAVSNYKDDDIGPKPVMHIGSLTFAETGVYLFKIAP